MVSDRIIHVLETLALRREPFTPFPDYCGLGVLRGDPDSIAGHPSTEEVDFMGLWIMIQKVGLIFRKVCVCGDAKIQPRK
jgi:hypothetical protein